MKTLLYLPLLTAMMLAMISCKKDQDKELEKLNEMYTEIRALSESHSYVPIPTTGRLLHTELKACGGPIGYIAYSNEIDVAYFSATSSKSCSKARSIQPEMGH
jgi:hypothetical protein